MIRKFRGQKLFSDDLLLAVVCHSVKLATSRIIDHDI